LLKLFAVFRHHVDKDVLDNCELLMEWLAKNAGMRPNRAGAFQKHEFRKAVRQLGVPAAEADTIFDSLDSRGGQGCDAQDVILPKDLAWASRAQGLIYSGCAMLQDDYTLAMPEGTLPTWRSPTKTMRARLGMAAPSPCGTPSGGSSCSAADADEVPAEATGQELQAGAFFTVGQTLRSTKGVTIRKGQVGKVHSGAAGGCVIIQLANSAVVQTISEANASMLSALPKQPANVVFPRPRTSARPSCEAASRPIGSEGPLEPAVRPVLPPHAEASERSSQDAASGGADLGLEYEDLDGDALEALDNGHSEEPAADADDQQGGKAADVDIDECW